VFNLFLNAVRNVFFSKTRTTFRLHCGHAHYQHVEQKFLFLHDRMDVQAVFYVLTATCNLSVRLACRECGQILMLPVLHLLQLARRTQRVTVTSPQPFAELSANIEYLETEAKIGRWRDKNNPREAHCEALHVYSVDWLGIGWEFLFRVRFAFIRSVSCQCRTKDRHRAYWHTHWLTWLWDEVNMNNSVKYSAYKV